MEPHGDDDFLEADGFEVFTVEELLAEDEIIEDMLAEEFKAADDGEASSVSCCR
uniref:Uncharacterized protein n=1 Tax=Leersia perrieri TaxID=77586 RepID=A0A0D9W3T1_9ORYZ